MAARKAPPHEQLILRLMRLRAPMTTEEVAAVAFNSLARNLRGDAGHKAIDRAVSALERMRAAGRVSRDPADGRWWPVVNL